MYDLDVPTHLNEKLGPQGHLKAPVMTPQPLFLLKYLERYPTCLDTAGFRCVRADGNVLQVRKCMGECSETFLWMG